MPRWPPTTACCWARRRRCGDARLAANPGHRLAGVAGDAADAERRAVEGAADSEAALRAALAERDGPLVALHVCVQPTEADLYRLVAERTVSVNTTAAGGSNASLMTIGD